MLNLTNLLQWGYLKMKEIRCSKLYWKIFQNYNVQIAVQLPMMFGTPITTWKRFCETPTCLKSSISPWTNVRKLLCRVICCSGFRAILPNTWVWEDVKSVFLLSPKYMGARKRERGEKRKQLSLLGFSNSIT